jgi:hypothetical protein
MQLKFDLHILILLVTSSFRYLTIRYFFALLFLSSSHASFSSVSYISAYLPVSLSVHMSACSSVSSVSAYVYLSVVLFHLLSLCIFVHTCLLLWLCYVCVRACVCVCVCTYLIIYPNIHRNVYLFMYLIYLSVRLCIYLYVSVFKSVHLSVYLTLV